METRFEFAGIRFFGERAYADVKVTIEHSQSRTVGNMEVTLNIPLSDGSGSLAALRDRSLQSARRLLNVQAAEDLLRSEISKDPKADPFGIGPRG